MTYDIEKEKREAVEAGQTGWCRIASTMPEVR